MKKKLFGMLLAATLVLAQTATVFAAGSAEATQQGTKKAINVVNDATELTEEQKATVTDQLVKAEKNDVSAIVSAAGKSIGTVKSTVVDDAEGKTHTITVTPLSNVKWRAFHFSFAKKAWEEVKVEVGSTGEVITAYLNDNSPIVFVAEEVTSSGKKKHRDKSSDEEETVSSSAAATTAADGGVATSPKTGVESDWAVWMAAAVVLAGTAGVSFKKRRA